jgi:hypothetical protein
VVECFQKSNAQGVAQTAAISFTVCVGLAICATTIKDVRLRLPQISNGCSKRQRLSTTVTTCGTESANASFFAANVESRPYMLAAVAKIATNGTVSTVYASAVASNAESWAYTPAAFAKIATCGTVGNISG